MGNKNIKLSPKMKASSKKPVNSQSKKRREKNDFDWDAWEQEARRRSAWGGYVQTMNIIKTQEEEKEYQHAKAKRDDCKIKEIEKKRKERTPMLYIG